MIVVGIENSVKPGGSVRVKIFMFRCKDCGKNVSKVAEVKPRWNPDHEKCKGEANHGTTNFMYSQIINLPEEQGRRV